MDDLKNSRVIIVAVVYLSLFLDNVLLTVVGNYNQATQERGRPEAGLSQLICKCFSTDYSRLSVHARCEHDRECRDGGRKRSGRITVKLEGSGSINFESSRGHSHRHLGLY
jgi:hypothetical protein